MHDPRPCTPGNIVPGTWGKDIVIDCAGTIDTATRYLLTGVPDAALPGAGPLRVVVDL